MVQTFLQRTIWGSVWLAAMAVTFLLCADLARDQPILLAIIVLAAIVQSVALVYSRSLWRDGNLTSAAAALFVGILALGVSLVSEVSYWSATIDGVHAQIQREKARLADADAVMDRRRKQLTNDPGAKLPSQIEAELQNASKAQLPVLRAELKAARDLEALSAQVFSNSTVETPAGIKRSLFDAASMGAEIFGGQARTWIFGIVTLIVSCMLALHVLSLYIGFAPRKPREARVRAEALPPIIVAPQPVLAPEALALAFVKPEEPEPEPVTPPEPPRGPKKEEVAEPAIGSKQVQFTDCIKPMAPPKEPFKPRVVENVAKPRSKAERDEAVDSLTRRWINARNVTQTIVGTGIPGPDAYADYSAFAGSAKVNDSHFGRSVKRCGFAAKKTATGVRYMMNIAGEREAVA